jgi:predicted nucleic acid-binding protein
MSGRFFLDTNIFVYAFDRDAPAKARRADDLIEEAIATRRGKVSFQVVQEFFNVALRRFEPQMTSGEAEQYLSSTFRPLLAVHSSHALYSEALHMREKYRISWYDCMIAAAAIEADCSILYSEDLQHMQRFGSLQVMNPFSPGIVQ